MTGSLKSPAPSAAQMGDALLCTARRGMEAMAAHERLAGTDAVSRLLVAQLAGEKRLVLWGKELIRLLPAI